ncbi:SURF1 family cytochrome oxidase biogenesis protein [Erythrobacter sp. AP23]|uniref:SURF1 family cytochrome oxidase biogenesis protein n=1 Tax=Erythrobacter sp. AP23 TaxID=499656 RepID=UPI00076C27BF|nr:SURF1 family cytochrome oxidase biogenesis protein [Erythrobacter sp. AP23]KWV94398.1 threonine synthase [Erythrobacter sp. AP23]
MTMRVPVFPTIIVVAAVATMIALGIWQLDRKGEKEALIASAQQAAAMSSEVDYPADPAERDELLYRRTTVACEQVESMTSIAGRSADGRNGVAQRATCRLADGSPALVDIGFSRDPTPVEWDGGEISGVIAPGGRIVATKPATGLEPLAQPDPASLPNNHLAYAGQWFFFALTALVIYFLALRRRSTRARAD